MGGYGSSDAVQARIYEILFGGGLNEQTIAELGQLLTIQQMAGQQQEYDLANRGYDAQNQEFDYKMDYNNFLRDELGYKGDQLAFAREQFDFASGPEFEFYKQERGMQHDAQMKGYEAQMQTSGDDVLQSANHLQQTRLNTDIASMNRDMARFQMAQQMGMAGPITHNVPKVLQQAGY
jgi:hypothetical protein